MAPPDEKELTLVTAPLTQMDTIPLEADLRFRANKKPSAGGGDPNDNPGAGDGDGFGLARFGEGGELIRGVSVKVGDPQFTLIWNTDGVDLDLHVLEPGGKEIFWEDPKGAEGGELDVDNTKGFGPENVYWLVETDGPGSEKVKGPGPPGVYKWYVVYWGGFGGLARPTHWQVRVKHDGQVNVYHGKFKALNERSKIHTLKVDPPGHQTHPLNQACGIAPSRRVSSASPDCSCEASALKPETFRASALRHDKPPSARGFTTGYRPSIQDWEAFRE